jgi:hypothetical protein
MQIQGYCRKKGLLSVYNYAKMQYLETILNDELTFSAIYMPLWHGQTV